MLPSMQKYVFLYIGKMNVSPASNILIQAIYYSELQHGLVWPYRVPQKI